MQKDEDVWKKIKPYAIADEDLKKSFYEYGVKRALEDENFKKEMAEDGRKRTDNIYYDMIGRRVITIALSALSLSTEQWLPYVINAIKEAIK